eukprot:evm.model.scf_89.21 EVM.evm.TU.scf_89.21   scf_89:117257-118550(+)
MLPRAGAGRRCQLGGPSGAPAAPPPARSLFPHPVRRTSRGGQLQPDGKHASDAESGEEDDWETQLEQGALKQSFGVCCCDCVSAVVQPIWSVTVTKRYRFVPCSRSPSRATHRKPKPCMGPELFTL